MLIKLFKTLVNTSMQYKISTNRIDARGTAYYIHEPQIEMDFKAIVQYLSSNPWDSWMVGEFLTFFFVENKELVHKLIILDQVPNMKDSLTSFLGLSGIDLYIAISLIEWFLLEIGASIGKSLESSDQRFQYLPPSLRRMYDLKLKDSIEVFALLKAINSIVGCLDTEFIHQLRQHDKKRLLTLSKTLAGAELNRKFTPIKALQKRFIEKRDFNNYTSIREASITETISRFKKENLLEKIGTKMSSIKETEYHFGSYHYQLKRKLDLKIDNLDISAYGDVDAFGKGVSKEISWASMAAEAVERYSAIMGIPDWPDCYVEDLNYTLSTLTDLEKSGEMEGYSVLNPNDMNLVVPYKNEETYWVRGSDTKGKSIYVLAEAVFFPYLQDKPRFRVGLSNGLASGNTLEEAKLHAYYEILERDAKQCNMGSGELFILKSNGSTLVNRILNHYNKQRIPVFIRDITMELGIPSYRLYVYSKDGRNYTSCGISLDGQEALLRAFGELNPNVTWAIETENLLHDFPTSSLSWSEYDLATLPNFSSGNVKEDLRLLEQLFELNKINAYTVNLTVKKLGFPVIRAIIPGWEHEFLCHNNSRFFSHLYKALKYKSTLIP